MKLLLDTHVLLWTLSNPSRLDSTLRGVIEDPTNLVFVSAASAWEIEVKRALGKLEAPDDLGEQLERLRFTELPVRIRHLRMLRVLPPLHRDPFDRVLIAQAQADDLTLATHDERVLAYPVRTLRA